MNYYPLLLSAPLKDYIWGGNRLKDEYGFHTDLDKVAEAWVLSARSDGDCTILNGELAGKSLTEVISLWGSEALGKNCDKFEYFPLLIKLIDAKDKLSVQVHPSDEYALRVEGEYGKTEMWYVLDCDEGACLIYGFNHELSKEEFKQRIESNTLEEVCNFVPVRKGDVFFIDAGTLHAIGKGILIAEVQQNSNTTYRVSDYGRLGADGKPRTLHIQKALDVTKTKASNVNAQGFAPFTKDDATVQRLVTCDKFSSAVVTLDGDFNLCSEDSFVSILLLDGEASAIWSRGEVTLQKGSCLFVPAECPVKLHGNARFLVAHV